MKKIYILIVLMLILILPLKVDAAEIVGKAVSTKNSVLVGEEFTVNFTVNFTGLTFNSNYGIDTIEFALYYDPEVLVATEINGSDYYSVLSRDKANNQYIVTSTVLGKEYIDSNNYCLNDILMCVNNYNVSIKFYVKDTSKTSTSVIMGVTGAALVEATDINDVPNDEDFDLITDTSTKSKIISISKKNEVTSTPPKDIVSSEKTDTKINMNIPKISTNETTSQTENISKSDNAYLDELVVRGYDLIFDKEKNNYTVTILEGENSVSIRANTEDLRASYTITGADDLKKSNNKVTIEVVSESGNKNIYTINIEYEKAKKFKSEFSFKSFFNKYKKYIIVGASLLGGIVLIIILLSIFGKSKDKKIDKIFDEF